MVASASTNAASGPLPVPVISCSTPSTLTTAVIASVPPSTSDAVDLLAHPLERGDRGQVLLGEDVPHLLRRDLAALAVGDLLDRLGELDLQTPRQLQAVVGLHDVGDAALAGLRVDPDHGLVGAAHVLRVDRQVGHLPDDVVDVGVRRRRPSAFIASKPLLIASWWLPENAV